MDLGTPGVGKEFSCYDELKSILVAKGVPSDEIAFIHEAKTDDQKEALFSRVRSGQDGSTTWLYATEAGKALKARLIGAETQLMRSNEKSAPLNISIGRIELRLCSPNAIATGRDSLFTTGQPMVAGFIEDEPLPTMHFTPSNSDRGNGAKLREWYDAAGRAAELASKLELVNRQILLLSDNQDLGDWAHQAELDELKAKKLELDTCGFEEVMVKLLLSHPVEADVNTAMKKIIVLNEVKETGN
eukprot:gene19883-30578_t